MVPTLRFMRILPPASKFIVVGFALSSSAIAHHGQAAAQIRTSRTLRGGGFIEV
jgi:hypothetical protein